VAERDKAKETRRQIADADKQIAAIASETRLKSAANNSSLIGQAPTQHSDGRVPVVVRYLHDNLNDPYSMKLLNWSKIQQVEKYGQRYWYVGLRMRAKNGFGAYIPRDVGFYLRNNRVVFTDNL
jgi:hypothetical protein